MEGFGLRLQQLRENKKLTQEELGDALGLSRMTISSYERSLRTPDANTVYDLAKYFKVTSDYLLGLSAIQQPERLRPIEELGFSDIALDKLRINEQIGMFIQGKSVPRAKTIDFLSSLLEINAFYHPFLDMLYVLSESRYDDYYPQIDLMNSTLSEQQNNNRAILDSQMHKTLDGIIKYLHGKSKEQSPRMWTDGR